MNNIDCLVEVMTAESDLAEQLVEVMKQQQQYLVACNAEGVAGTVEQQQELLLPLEGLEQERERLSRDLWNTVAPEKAADDRPVNLSALIGYLSGPDAERVSNAGHRLLSTVETMMKLNQANQFLIEHSRKFVRETLRIITNDHARQLVDRKM